MAESIPNLRHLRVLLEVERGAGFSAAARSMHLSQPAVTQAVMALERYFGAALFDRTSRGVTPTAAGRLCLMRVERALGQLSDGVREVSADISRNGGDVLRTVTAAQLVALVAVVEAGGFGRAARASGAARTTIHGAARQLELAIRMSLFEITSHGRQPTREAMHLARAARLAVAELAQATAEVAAMQGDDRGGTVIGTMPLARSVIVPAALVRFAALRPRHAISILDGPYDTMLGALLQGRAELLVGALRDSAGSDILQEHLFDDPLAIIVRAGHPLVAAAAGGDRPPPMAALTRFPWIAPRPGSPLRRHFDALLDAMIDGPQVSSIECNSLAAARGLLLASDRVMVLSAHQVRYELAAGQLVALPHPFGRVVRSIGLTIRRGWRPTEAQSQLLEFIRLASREPGISGPHVPASRDGGGCGKHVARRPSVG